MPLLLGVGLICGIVWLIGSGHAKAVFTTVALLGGVILIVIGQVKLFPTFFLALATLFALGMYALMIVGAILGIVMGPAKEQSR